MWFKNRRAKFRKKQRASKSHLQRSDSPSADGGSSAQCKSKDEDRRRGQPDRCFHTHDDASSAADTGPQTTSDSVDEEEDDEEDQGRPQCEDHSLPSSMAVFQGDVRHFSPLAGAGSNPDRISTLSFHGLHPFQIRGTYTSSICTC